MELRVAGGVAMGAGRWQSAAPTCHSAARHVEAIGLQGVP